MRSIRLRRGESYISQNTNTSQLQIMNIAVNIYKIDPFN